MSASETLLVYDRIDANRRNTVLLLAVFPALLLPFIYGLSHVLPLAYGLVFSDVTVTEIVRLATIAFAAFIFALGFACFGHVFISSFLLWYVSAQRAGRDQEPGLFRTVENLCIGAGLPPPTLYIVESTEPNAFTTGSNPRRASLIVTRGLLRLLDERELRGVVAHELSHIGNCDTSLSNLLAALVATMRFPLAVVKAVLSFASNVGPYAGAIAAFLIGSVLFVVIVVVVVGSTIYPGYVGGISLTAREAMMLVAALYAFVIAPAAGMWFRQIISHQREFLADADAALLTRDPEGLALALAKVSAATESAANADVATAHLYFVDPLPRTASWWDNNFPSHPPVDKRISLLARMGDGIADRTLADATAKGLDYTGQQLLKELQRSPEWSRTEGPEPGACVPGAVFRLTDSQTMLHKSAEESSPVLADLDANVPITVVDLQPQAIHVRLGDGTVGYIRLLAGLEPFDDEPDGNRDTRAEGINGIHYRRESPRVANPEIVSRLRGTQFRLTDESTPLYAEPDGWSDVVQHLASGTIVEFNEVVGAFARVAADGTVGYISKSAHVVRTDTG